MDLQTWRERYDRAETSAGEFDLGGVAWQTCVSSDLPRARQTAKAVFDGAIRHTDLLREPLFNPFQTGRLRLPVWLWLWVLRWVLRWVIR